QWLERGLQPGEGVLGLSKLHWNGIDLVSVVLSLVQVSLLCFLLVEVSIMTPTIFFRWCHGSVPSITSSLSPSTSCRTTCTSHVCNELCCLANSRHVNDHEAIRDGSRQRQAACARTPHLD
ncbi:unnamed protein product, partial [Scytosiphon promiscuus]